MTTKMRLKIKNRSQSYDINRTRPRHESKYTKYKMCFSIMMVICMKQHLSNKGVAYKKACTFLTGIFPHFHSSYFLMRSY